MFCVTFYSFKGGVGRTLALANTAALLAARGKKVLVVDFDLEAPGLGTLEPFTRAAGGFGVLDFVRQYLDTGAVPDLAGFVHRCGFEEDVVEDDTGEAHLFYHTLDFMPAGAPEDYARNFADLDWNRLYLERDGFLLMETLRERWERAGYDYVLIDSRTGHTDVGGICTRQLPDAVVALFFPNEQNLQGLKEVVGDVRNSGARPRPIDLVFAASRVPRLDDEFGDLARWLDRFKSELSYRDDEFVRIEHYDSLRLLDQELFAITRPRSGLGQQYLELANTLVQYNDEDADGAFRYASNVARSRAEIINKGGEERSVIERLSDISKAHQNDGHVQFALARAFYRLRSLSLAAEAAEYALAARGQTRTRRPVPAFFGSSIHRLRLKTLLELDRAEEALDSAYAILLDDNATITTVIDAILAISAHPFAALGRADDYPAITQSAVENQFRLVSELADVPKAQTLAADISELLLARPDLPEIAKSHDLGELQLQLIADGRFAIAKDVVGPIKDPVDAVRYGFNRAMAEWGETGTADRQAFADIANEIESQDLLLRSPNGRQCLALCHAVNGNTDQCDSAAAEAHRLIEAQLRREFSCWSFQKEPVAEFKDHLDDIREFARNGDRLPLVIVRNRHVPNGRL